MRCTLVPLGSACNKEGAELIVRLLDEIEVTMKQSYFDTMADDVTKNLEAFCDAQRYFGFLALTGSEAVGIITMYESQTLYSGGAFGTIAELYVNPFHRGKGIGNALLKAAADFGRTKRWRRFEVTTPPLPAFERTLRFYEANGFSVSGGRKLAITL